MFLAKKRKRKFWWGGKFQGLGLSRSLNFLDLDWGLSRLNSIFYSRSNLEILSFCFERSRITIWNIYSGEKIKSNKKTAQLWQKIQFESENIITPSIHQVFHQMILNLFQEIADILFAFHHVQNIYWNNDILETNIWVL